LGKPATIPDLLEQEMMGWQWHQLDHMEIICTSFQTDNHTSTSSLSFYRLDALPDDQPTVKALNSIKALKAIRQNVMQNLENKVFRIVWIN